MHERENMNKTRLSQFDLLIAILNYSLQAVAVTLSLLVRVTLENDMYV